MIADSLSAMSGNRDVAVLSRDDLTSLSFALRDLSARVGYMEARGPQDRFGWRARRTAAAPEGPGRDGAEIIEFPAAQPLDSRKNSAA